MKIYRTARWRLTIKSEEYLVTILNRIRRRSDILNRRGYFKLSTLKLFADGKHYTTFKIPKRRGGYRQISSPQRNLAFIQECLAVLFNSIYRPNNNAFGFVDNKSIVDNAAKHVGKDIVYNLDLKDFFDSITYDTVIEKLIRQPYYFSYSSARLIANLLTVKKEDGRLVVPQGAPSSPILTNMIADHMDVRLSKFAEKHNLTYSRYADDITFSFNKSVLRGWRGHGLCQGLKDIIFDIIKTEGFIINEKKTRISFVNQRHEVTGLIVNKKTNIKRSYIKQLRTEIHNWEKDGYVIASYNFFNHYVGTNSHRKLSPMERVIDGKLSFVKMVKGNQDSTYKKLKDRFDRLYKRDAVFFNMGT